LSHSQLKELLVLGLGADSKNNRPLAYEAFEIALSVIAERRFPGEGQGLLVLIASYLAPLAQRIGLSAKEDVDERPVRRLGISCCVALDRYAAWVGGSTPTDSF